MPLALRVTWMETCPPSIMEKFQSSVDSPPSLFHGFSPPPDGRDPIGHLEGLQALLVAVPHLLHCRLFCG